MKKALLLCLVFIFSMLLTGQSTKSFSPVLTYQGIVKDDSGNPLKDGQYSVLFKIYEDETADKEIWTEKQELNLNSGILNATIGSIVDLKLPFDRQYWLGVSINGEEYGRSPLSASAYSMFAKSISADAIVGKNGITVEKNAEGKLEISGQIVGKTRGLGWQPNYSDPNVQYTEANYNCGIGVATPTEKLTVEGGLSLREKADSTTASANYGKVYTKTDKNLYYMDSNGDESKLNKQTVPDKIYIEYSVDPNAPQTFSNGVAAAINYNKKVVDDYNYVTTGSAWSFTSPKTTTYLVQGKLTFVGSTNWMWVYYTSDSRWNYIGGRYFVQTTGMDSYTAIIKMNAGEKLLFTSVQSSSGARTLNNSPSQNYIIITEL